MPPFLFFASMIILPYSPSSLPLPHHHHYLCHTHPPMPNNHHPPSTSLFDSLSLEVPFSCWLWSTLEIAPNGKYRPGASLQLGATSRLGDPPCPHITRDGVLNCTRLFSFLKNGSGERHVMSGRQKVISGFPLGHTQGRQLLTNTSRPIKCGVSGKLCRFCVEETGRLKFWQQYLSMIWLHPFPALTSHPLQKKRKSGRLWGTLWYRRFVIFILL